MTATAASAEWTSFHYSDEIILYIDRATIRRKGDFVKMWELIDFKAVQNNGIYSYLTQRSQHEFDCKEEQTRLLAFSWLSGKMGSGSVVYSNSDVGKWSPIAPNTIDEAQWKIACGK